MDKRNIPSFSENWPNDQMDRIRRKIEKIKKSFCLPSLVIFFTGQIIPKKQNKEREDIFSNDLEFDSQNQENTRESQ